MSHREKKVLLYSLLFVLLVTGFLLRIQQTQRFQVPDEAQLAQMVLALHDAPFPPGNYPGYPGYPPLFLYLHLILSLLMQKILLFLGVIQFPGQFLRSGFGYAFILTFGRIISAAIGVIPIWVLFRLVRREYNRTAALTASLLITVNLHLVFDSHIFKPDILLVALLTLFIDLSFRYVDQPIRKRLFWCSLIFGLSVAAKYNAVVEIVFLAAVMFFVLRKNRELPIFSHVMTSIAGMAIGFFAGAPNWLVHPLKNIEEAYRYVTYHYAAFHFYDKGNAYTSYFRMLFDSFGAVPFVLFLAGVIAALIRKKQKELLLLIYFFIYIAVLGRSAYFGTRIILPLLPVMAYFIAGFSACTLPRYFSRRPVWKKRAAIAMVALLCTLSLFDMAKCARHFNLLRSSTTYSQALVYRVQHIPYEFPLGRENLTPAFRGDVGFSDLNSIDIRFFRGPDALRFLCSGLFSKYILEKTKNYYVKAKLQKRLSSYTPIYKIRKPRFSTFDDDVTFWYRKPRYVGELNLDQPVRGLPRLFALDPDEFPWDTIYLPLQNFEKNPFLGRTSKGVWAKILHSRLQLKTLTFHILVPDVSAILHLKVNGQERDVTLEPKKTIHSVTFDRIRPRLFHHDWIYSVQAAHDSDLGSLSMVLEPEFVSPPKELSPIPLFPRETPGSLPSPGKAPPEWCKTFYDQTRIDPALLEFIQTQRMWENPDLETDGIELPEYFFNPGTYVFRFQGRPIVQGLRDQVAPLTFQYTTIERNGRIERTVSLTPSPETQSLALSVQVTEPAFFRIQIRGQREANFIVTKITVNPDIPDYINRFWVSETGRTQK